MANTIGWGQAAVNNTIDWGKGKTNNAIGWGSIYSSSPSGETDISGTPAGDADANAFIAAAAITDTTQKAAIDKLVVDLKGYGIWTKMKAIYPFIGGTAAQHKYNLRSPVDSNAAFRLVFNGGWTHSATGALPNGTNAWANTFFKGGNYTSKDNAHMTYYSRTDFNGSVMVDIGLDEANNSNIRSRDGNITYVVFNGGSGLSGATANSLGLFMANRNALNTLNGWKNSTKISQIASTSVSSNISSFSLAAYNNALNNPSYYSLRQCAFSSFGDGLTDTEAANFNTAVQVFQTTLSRNV